MMFKVTKNNLKGELVIACGDGDAYNLLQGLRRVGYNTGKYGWNYNAYAFDGIVLISGYRTNVGARVEYLKDYEKRAEKICAYKADLGLSEWDRLLKKLRREFAIRVLCDVEARRINYVV